MEQIERAFKIKKILKTFKRTHEGDYMTFGYMVIGLLNDYESSIFDTEIEAQSLCDEMNKLGTIKKEQESIRPNIEIVLYLQDDGTFKQEVINKNVISNNKKHL